MSNNLLPWRLTRRQWIAVAIGVAALAGIAWTVLHRSDRERLDDVLESGLAALEEGDVDAAMEDVSPDFQSYGLDRDGLEELLRTAVRRYRQPDLSALKKEFRIQERLASCRFTLLAWGPGDARRPVRTRWTVSFGKTDGRWLIIGIESRSGLGDRLQRARSLADEFGIELDPQE